MLLTSRVLDLARTLPTPVLILDLDEVRSRYCAIRTALPGDRRLLRGEGQSSSGESSGRCARPAAASRCRRWPSLSLRFSAGRLAPTSSPATQSRRRSSSGERSWPGSASFAFDSPAEVEKLASDAPGADALVRVTVDNSGSEWPLARKYGVDPAEAVDLLFAARDAGLVPAGVTFHVGSQCTRTESWIDALDVCREVFDLADQAWARSHRAQPRRRAGRAAYASHPRPRRRRRGGDGARPPSLPGQTCASRSSPAALWLARRLYWFRR